MIDIITAIDLMDGKCVRLSKGDFNTKKIYGSEPVDMAMLFEDSGFTRLHLVDLDGAEGGRLKHLRILEQISVKTGLKIDFGGGIKSLADVRSVMESGACMVCLGSMAVKNENEFDLALSTYGPEKILLAADAADEQLVISGWKEAGNISLFDFLEKMIARGITQVLCTDVNKDGMLGGTSVKLYEKIMERFPALYLIASGGVSGIGDIEALEASSIPAVVFGKAFYEGRLSLKELKSFL
ncbi:MAG: 1-(5-phosphoribosyl)-5-[(5-phosphoribosylamino)methylideneamino]imidazole-4-carboxamide isomerase [Bacteroidales bacterium]